MKVKKIATNEYLVTAKAYPLNLEQTKSYQINLQKLEDAKNDLHKWLCDNEELKAAKAIILSQQERIRELGGFDA